MALFCPSCGTQVRTEIDLSDDLQLTRCAACGLVLAHQPIAGAKSAAVLGKVAVKRVRPEDLHDGPVLMGTAVIDEPAPEPPQAQFGRVILAEDVALHRAMLEETLTQRGLAQSLTAVENGEAFLTAATRELIAGQPIDLCMLDVEMPVLNGYNAAVGLRAIERAFGAPPAPVLFFTAKACDESFKRVLQYCAPARYLNKAGSGGPAQLFGRIEQVLRTFQGVPAMEGS